MRANSKVRFVTASRVNLRSGPSTDESVVTVVTEGAPVFPERIEGPWALVRVLSGPVGWIHTSLLR